MPERRARGVLRDHVPREIDADEGQAALRDGRAEDASPRERRVRDVRVVGNVEGVRGRRLEALEATPSNILELEEGAIRDSRNGMLVCCPFMGSRGGGG